MISLLQVILINSSFILSVNCNYILAELEIIQGENQTQKLSTKLLIQLDKFLFILFGLYPDPHTIFKLIKFNESN